MFKSIVVGTDGSVPAQRAVRTAVELARMCSAALHVVTAYRLPHEMLLVGPMGVGLVPVERDDEVRSEVERMLATLAEEIRDQGVAVTTHALRQHPVAAILDVQDQQKADLIVVGNRGLQQSRSFVGQVLHHAPCTVLVVDTGTSQRDGGAQT